MLYTALCLNHGAGCPISPFLNKMHVTQLIIQCCFFAGHAVFLLISPDELQITMIKFSDAHIKGNPVILYPIFNNQNSMLWGTPSFCLILNLSVSFDGGYCKK